MVDVYRFWVLPSIELELRPTNEFPDLGVINNISTPLKTLIAFILPVPLENYPEILAVYILSERLRWMGQTPLSLPSLRPQYIIPFQFVRPKNEHRTGYLDTFFCIINGLSHSCLGHLECREPRKITHGRCRRSQHYYGEPISTFQVR